ncbi:hypothetical protein [Enterococcus sp. AZ109]|uniref:hypothetical protein n=1 Tax=Enterococcus sp. AZ109 TaxID=2774634 RepID=UPI003F1FAFE7
MAEKAQEKKQETKTNQATSTVSADKKMKVVALSNSGDGTTLKVKIDNNPVEIIHGEVLELTEKQLQKLKIASSSWNYEEVKGDKQ